MRDGGVAVAFFGDGAPAQGAFHEAVNLAAVWGLPAVFFCENNGYAEFSPVATQHVGTLEARAAGYGVGYVAVDGNDVVATATVMADVVTSVRAGAGPVVVEAATYRWHGHYEGDPERYRSPEELEEWRSRDPLVVHERVLRSVGRARRRAQGAGGVGGDGARRRRRGGPPPGPAVALDAVGLRGPPSPVRARAAARRAGRPGVPHDGRGAPGARDRAVRPTSACSWRASTWGRAATSSA